MNYAVITACYNSEKTIQRTINSVLSQTILPNEYFFVDGGSTDKTLNTIDESIIKSNKLNVSYKIIHQKTNGGIYEAWNYALREVTSDIICILNSDDWYLNDSISYVIEEFILNPRAEILLGAGRYVQSEFDNKGYVCRTRSFNAFPFAMTVIHPACFVKKTVYDRIGVFDDKYRVAGDYEFLYRCYKSRIIMIKTRKVLVNVQLGGYAEKNKITARKEVLEIALKYSMFKIFPLFAYFIRVILRK